MPNDTKLGLLTGVAGVVAAAVLYSQTPQPSPPAPPAAAANPAPATTLARSGQPAPATTAVPDDAVAATGRPEVEGRAVSRPAGPDE
jgi:hypothetical protein